MRPGQNKRMRGRNNTSGNNRKGPNPLTRSYESNGPDVKIRGTAHHVAEKYLQLARDAQSSGDPVMAESYLQHAEHYFRLIATAQLAQLQAQAGYQRQPGDPDPDDADDDDDVGGLPDRFSSPAERFSPPPPQPQYAPNPQPQPPAQPQPYADRPAYQNDRGGQQNGERPYQDRNDRQPRQDRNFQDRGERQPRQDRPYQDRNDQNRSDQNRFNQNRQPRDNRPQREPRFDAPRDQQQPAIAAEPTELPSFITTPVRIPTSEPRSEPRVEQIPVSQVSETPESNETAEAGGFHLRPRRRRRTRSEGSDEGTDGQTSLAPGDPPAGE